MAEVQQMQTSLRSSVIIDGIQETITQINQLNEANKGLAESTKKAVQEETNLSRAQRAVASSLKESKSQTLEYINSLKDEVNAGIIPLETAHKRLQDTRKRSLKRLDGIDKQIQDLTNERNGVKKNSEQYQDFSLQIDLLKDKKASLTNVIAQQSKALNQFTNILGKANKDVKTTIDQMQKYEKAVLTSYKAGTMSAVEATEKLDNKLRALEVAYKQLSGTKTNSEQEEQILQAKLNSLDRQIAGMKASKETIIRLEESSLKEKTKIWNKEVAVYKSIQKQLKAESSIKYDQANTDTMFHSVLNASVALAGIRTLTSEFQKLGREVIDINYNTINTQRIMGDYSKALAESLEKNAVEMAKNSNIAITEAQKIQSAWVRINDQYAKSPELLDKIASATAKFMNVGEIENADEAVMLINASMLQFNLTVDEGIETLNKWAYMADKTALGTADEFGKAMSKVGGFMQSIKGGVDDAIVMTSILADRLAKDGDEVGNSLKTISSYLTRQKTMNLFDELDKQVQGMDFSLRNANGTFKEFSGLMDTTSRAYEYFSSLGTGEGDTIAKRIQEAVGATRQGDVALSLLQNWQSESEKYYGMINDSVSGEQSYLEAQNEALLATFEARFNAFRTSIQDFGMAVARGGALDMLGDIMGGIESLFTIVSKLPAPILEVGIAFSSWKIIESVLGYIGKSTGVTQKYQQLVQHGTKAEIEHAMAVSKSANAYLQKMTDMRGAKELTQQEIHTLSMQEIHMAQLADAYNNGSITAVQYEQALVSLIGKEQLESQVVALTTDELLAQVGATKAHIAVKQQEANGIKNVTNSTLFEAKTKKIANAEDKKAITVKGALMGLITKMGIAQNATAVTTAYMTLKQELLNSSVTRGAVQIGGLSFSVLPQLALSSGLAGSAIAFLGASFQLLMSTVFPVMAIVTAVTSLFSFFNTKSEETTNKIDSLNTKLSETKTALEDVKASQEKGVIGLEGEIAYLETKISLLEDELKIQKQLEAYNNSKAIFKDANDNIARGGGRNGSQNGIGLTTRYSQFQTEAELIKQDILQARLEGNEKKAEQLTKKLTKFIDDNEETLSHARENYGDIVSSITDIEEILPFLKGSKITEAEAKLVSLKALLEEYEGLSSVDSNETVQIEKFSLDPFLEGIDGTREKIKTLQSDMDSIFEGTASSEDLARMAQKYEGFSDVIGKSTQEQIMFLKELELKIKGGTYEELVSLLDELVLKRKTYEEIISTGSKDGVGLNEEELKAVNDEYGNVIENIKIVQGMLDQEMTLKMELPDLGKFTSEMNSLVGATNDLAEAQQRLAQGTALSSKELYDLAMTYPELLYQADLFNTTTVDGQKQAIDSILDMNNQRFNQIVDLQIAELEMQKTALETELGIREEQMNLLLKAEVDRANGSLSTQEQENDLKQQYYNLDGEAKTVIEQEKLRKTDESALAELSNEQEKGEELTGLYNASGQAFVDSQNNAYASATVGGNTYVQKAGNIFNRIIPTLKGIANSIISAFTGKPENVKGVSPANEDSYSGANYTGASYGGSSSYNGSSIADWINQTQNGLVGTIEGIKVSIGNINTAIGNLNNFKDLGLSGVNNNFGSGSNGGSGGGSGSSSSDKATQDLTKAIEQMTNTFVKNVESMQDRIVKALRKQYQEQYDERKKLLEKEHNERLEQIQAQIDALNGNTKEDKQSRLDNLYAQLAKWEQDDSTLGKQKQKEYLDAIKALEKEMAIDDLEEQQRIENENYQNSIDKDSEFYDAVLSKLDQQMTDEALYREANDLIRNGKIDEITALLTKYDSNWSGWATLMGKTAGEIISEEVANAIANYLDVVTGNVTADGGLHTNGVNGKPSTGGTSGGTTGGTSGGTSTSVTTGSKVKVSNQSGGMYYTSTSANPVSNWKGYGGEYYVVNSGNGRFAISRSNNIAGTIGWIKKGDVVGLATGGYTGEQEGLAMLHKKERVLNSSQTKAFEALVYDFLPKLSDKLFTTNGVNTSNNVTFNKELVSVNIDTLVQNKDFDMKNGIDNLDRAFRNSLKKSGVGFKR